MKWIRKFDTLFGKVLCACMAFSFTFYADWVSILFFGEIPYPEMEENTTK